MYDKVIETAEYLKNHSAIIPEVAIILGSGLGKLVDSMENPRYLQYEDIPNFPISTVEGHEGRLVFGKLEGRSVLAMQGRFHYYEGYSMKELTYPIYVMKYLNIKKIIITNAAGGINKGFNPGDLMFIEDFINLFKDNPLIGKNDERFGPRFPDMTEAYNKNLIKIAEEVCSENKIEYKKGIYAGCTGPNYETAAEIKFLDVIGADAVGMSTVPETIVANYLGMDVLGVSCITNMATGIAQKKHSHKDVVNIANIASDKFCKFIKEVLKKI